jgi:hypothetical protein
VATTKALAPIPQFGHRTFGKRLVSSSIAQNLGVSSTALYRSRIHYAGPRRVFI